MLSCELYRFCDSFGLNRQRVQQLIRNDFIRLEAGRPGPGRPARITTREAFRLALMIRLLDIGVPRQVAGAAVLDPVLFLPAAGDTRDHAAFFVISIGRLAPKIARFYAAHATPEPETDPEADVKAHVSAVGAGDTPDDDTQDRALFSWTTIPGHELAARLADERRDVSAVVALDALHRRVLDFFEGEQHDRDSETAE
jgi:hypothetical protein